RLISFGSSSFSSWFSVWISSSNFLIKRSFTVSVMGRAIVPQCYPSPLMTIRSRQNPLVARFRDAARGDAGEVMLLDGAHLVADAIAAQLRIDLAAVTPAAREEVEIQPLMAALAEAGVSVATV